MSGMKCPVCGIEYSSEAEYCAKCKAKLFEVGQEETGQAPKETVRKSWFWLVAGFLLMLGVIYGGYYLIRSFI